MKLIVTSDSHGKSSAIESAVRKHNNADVIVFCGDGYRDIDYIGYMFPTKMMIAVRGNCDWNCKLLDVQEITLCRKKIFITHGHLFGVKQDYGTIIAHGKSIGADIIIFGHTHRQTVFAENNMLVLNPGSIGYGGSYSTIEIDEDTGKIKAVQYNYNSISDKLEL